ncbi:hypothetical protein SCOCK_170020 [Actinacidiphila cocklensis]|uniref:Uncharacterized protein n=1 Tax=Actinacidiphila cocklensis TaxID=887465 RepID=A0A9W4E454_9ACTN|nr:hypothetical protein SCOCK_170020 [Actinacidiphila cocklensis]
MPWEHGTDTERGGSHAADGVRPRGRVHPVDRVGGRGTGPRPCARPGCGLGSLHGPPVRVSRTRRAAHALRRPARLRHQRPPGRLRLLPRGPRFGACGGPGRCRGGRGRGGRAQHGRLGGDRAGLPQARPGLPARPGGGEPRSGAGAGHHEQRGGRLVGGGVRARRRLRGHARTGGLAVALDDAPGRPAGPAPQCVRADPRHRADDARHADRPRHPAHLPGGGGRRRDRRPGRPGRCGRPGGPGAGLGALHHVRQPAGLRGGDQRGRLTVDSEQGAGEREQGTADRDRGPRSREPSGGYRSRPPHTGRREKPGAVRLRYWPCIMGA